MDLRFKKARGKPSGCMDELGYKTIKNLSNFNVKLGCWKAPALPGNEIMPISVHCFLIQEYKSKGGYQFITCCWFYLFGFFSYEPGYSLFRFSQYAILVYFILSVW